MWEFPRSEALSIAAFCYTSERDFPKRQFTFKKLPCAAPRQVGGAIAVSSIGSSSALIDIAYQFIAKNQFYILIEALYCYSHIAG